MPLSGLVPGAQSLLALVTDCFEASDYLPQPCQWEHGSWSWTPESPMVPSRSRGCVSHSVQCTLVKKTHTDHQSDLSKARCVGSPHTHKLSTSCKQRRASSLAGCSATPSPDPNFLFQLGSCFHSLMQHVRAPTMCQAHSTGIQRWRNPKSCLQGALSSQPTAPPCTPVLSPRHTPLTQNTEMPSPVPRVSPPRQNVRHHPV